MREGLTSGQVAQQADGNVQTVRDYERRKLLARPPRTEGGFRLYPAQGLARCGSLKKAQRLGFSLAEIQELLRIRGNGARCSDVKERLERKIADVDRKILELQTLRASLASLTRTCNDGATTCRALTQLG